MPTQYPYPKEDWAVGKMAKAGPMRGGDPGREYRELEGVRKRKESQASENLKGQPLTPEEWQGFWAGNWRLLGKDYKLNKDHQVDSNGILVEQGHPQIKELQDQGWTTHDIPDTEEGAGNRWRQQWQFMRPPVDDKTPVASIGGRVG